MLVKRLDKEKEACDESIYDKARTIDENVLDFGEG